MARSESQQSDDRRLPCCDGSGELHEVLTPMIDRRDPAYDVREWPCSGCPECDPEYEAKCVNCGGREADGQELMVHDGALWCAHYGDCDRRLYYAALARDIEESESDAADC